ncbi:SCO family protein [uncultured Psychroserpens sp.]|uniref:SCO family protein n=1 Tax=uncultured Psychroserpens sp. TaxID=255436 RepID=UPI0026046E80|nr:SCO family protein [uncultured Psychroserpens sp.]
MKLQIFILVFLVLMSCKKDTNALPILSYNYVNGAKELYKIDSFEFTNQDGNLITSDSTKGYVHTMNFFFTSCPSICPPMRNKQHEIVDTFSSEENFKQYSISIDYKKDSVGQLKQYATIHDIDSKQWQLLRGTSEIQLELLASRLKTNFKPNEDGTDFYHSSYVALIDKEQYIRGFYNILLNEEVELLKDDIKTLLDD